MAGFTGVYASNEAKIEIKAPGMSDFAEIAEMTDFDYSVDTTTEKWQSYANKGFQSALVTGHAFTLKIKAKRSIGDKANDALFKLSSAIGQAAYVDVKITQPDGSSTTYNTACAVTALPGGASTDVAGIEATFESNGKPTDTAASSS